MTSLETLFGQILPQPEVTIKENELLVYRFDKFLDSTPVTMETLNEKFQPVFDEKKLGKIFYGIDWYKNEEFYTKDTPRTGWFVISDGVLSDSKEKNWGEQLEIVKQHGETEQDIPTPVELVYDFIFLLLQNEKRILKNEWSRTLRLSSDGNLVDVGGCSDAGASVSSSRARRAHPALGVSLSRSLENLKPETLKNDDIQIGKEECKHEFIFLDKPFTPGYGVICTLCGGRKTLEICEPRKDYCFCEDCVNKEIEKAFEEGFETAKKEFGIL